MWRSYVAGSNFTPFSMSTDNLVGIQWFEGLGFAEPLASFRNVNLNVTLHTSRTHHVSEPAPSDPRQHCGSTSAAMATVPVMSNKRT